MGFCVLLYALICVLSRFAIILMWKRAGCFTLFVFLVSYDSVALPHGAVACQLTGSAVSDCSIF